mmetsp:Transcript_1025/g.2594  ORF Transcript_1025/g.2594 Transcript_1025/m.2594 type:complete len:409 (+) Transcript_1025:2413-3639(+)
MPARATRRSGRGRLSGWPGKRRSASHSRSWAAARAAASWSRSSHCTPIEEQWLVRPQHQIAIDDDPHRQARPFGQRRLDVHVAPDHLLADLVDAVLRAVASGDHDPVAVLPVLRRGQLGTHAQQRGQRRTREDAIPVPIDAILQAGVTGRVGAREVVELQRRRVRQDDAVPHHLHAALPVAHLAVVFAQDARALGDQQKLARGRVVDRLRHRDDHVARQVRLDARHQRPGDHRSRHDLIRRDRHLQIAGVAGFRRTAFQERLFLVLPVLHRGGVGRLGRRRGWPGGQRVEAGQGAARRNRSGLRCSRCGGLALVARAEEHRRTRRRISLLAPCILRVVPRWRIRRRHRLLRLHDGRAEIARQRRPQLGHLRRQLRVVGRQAIQPFGLRHAIDVVQLGLLARATPMRLQ